MKIKEILKLIEEDIQLQEELLQGDFELDRPIRWRIIGMKALKDRIIEGKNNKSERGLNKE